MGFYFGAEGESGLTEGYSPTITAREYVAQFSSVLASCAERSRRGCPRCELGLGHLAAGRLDAALCSLLNVIRQHPQDEHVHRLIGLAHLSDGHLRPARKHLEIALSLLRWEVATAIGLGEVFRLQCEAAVVRLLLIGLYTKLGDPQAARFLVLEALEVL